MVSYGEQEIDGDENLVFFLCCYILVCCINELVNYLIDNINEFVFVGVQRECILILLLKKYLFILYWCGKFKKIRRKGFRFYCNGI